MRSTDRRAGDARRPIRAIRARFDGKKVIVSDGVSGLLPGEVIVVFDERGNDAAVDDTWINAQADALRKVWDNNEDAIYDDLQPQ